MSTFTIRTAHSVSISLGSYVPYGVQCRHVFRKAAGRVDSSGTTRPCMQCYTTKTYQFKLSVKDDNYDACKTATYLLISCLEDKT
jgi:hypothetical protein